MQLVVPLIDERRGDDDEDARCRDAPGDLGDDEPGLNRLAESDLVGDQHSTRAVDYGAGGLELMRENVGVRAGERRDRPIAERPAEQIGAAARAPAAAAA